MAFIFPKFHADYENAWFHIGSWPLNPDICNLKFSLNRAGEREILEAIFGGRMEVGADMK